MARKPVDPNTRKINVQVAMPDDLAPELVPLWRKEFARFPPGYFTPSDVRGMVTYLEAKYHHDAAHAAMMKAYKTPKGPQASERRAFNDSFKQIIRMQANLRMFPSTRTHREIHGNMANNPAQQVEAPGGSGWRGLFAVPTEQPAPKRGRKAKG